MARGRPRCRVIGSARRHAGNCRFRASPAKRNGTPNEHPRCPASTAGHERSESRKIGTRTKLPRSLTRGTARFLASSLRDSLEENGYEKTDSSFAWWYRRIDYRSGGTSRSADASIQPASRRKLLRELLEPVPNALDALKTADAAPRPARLQLAQYHHHHHHHHHHGAFLPGFAIGAAIGGMMGSCGATAALLRAQRRMVHAPLPLLRSA